MTHPDTGELIATLEARLKRNEFVVILTSDEANAIISSLRSGHEAEERLAEADAVIATPVAANLQHELELAVWKREALARHTARQQEGK